MNNISLFLNKNRLLKDLFVFSSLLIIGFIFYGGTLTKPFLCDDYSVIYRLIIQKNFFIPGFFRPLSDLSLLFNFYIGQFNPYSYNFLNFLIHISCCFVLYKVALQLFPSKEQVVSYMPFVCSFLFLLYPFHVEAVVWIVGRGALIATFFALLSLYYALKPEKSLITFLLPCIFYFMGLCAYESILPLPAIIFVFAYERKKDFKDYSTLLISFSATIVLHIVLRYILSGSISGEYGLKGFNSYISGYILGSAKAIGRAILPPSSNSNILILCFVFLIIIICISLYFLVRRNNKFLVKQLFLALGFSFIVPAIFGVSTHTFEGGRLLYFPAIFLVLTFTYINSLTQKRFTEFIILICTTIYFCFYLNKNIVSWIEAGKITTYIINQSKQTKMFKRKTALLNVPQEYNGALIFRNGFKEALLMNNVDTAQVQILRTLTTEETRNFKGTISHKTYLNYIFIPPNSFLKDSIIKIIQPISSEQTSYKIQLFGQIYYWNRSELIRLK